MAVLKPRTAVVIVLTILAAAVFSLVLLPRWQSTKANSGSQRNDQSSPKSFAESLVTKFDKLEADKEAMWNRNPNPRAGQPETTKSVLSTPMRVNSQKPVSEIHVVGASSSESFQESNGPKPAPQKPPAAGGAEGDDGQRLLRKLKEISEESRPQSPEKLERTPNAVKYERLRSLLGRMHEPANMETPVDLRDEKPRLSTILEKEALERLVKQRNDEEAGARPVRLDADKGQEREIPLRYGIDNRQERERLGISKGQERLRQLKYEGEVHSRNDIMAPDLSPKADNSVNNAMGNFNPSLSDRHNAPTKATMRTSVLTTTSSFLTTVSSTPQPLLNPVKDLPSLKRGSVEIRPERLPPPAHSSDIYYSLLTAPVYHNLRFSLQYLTWLQTVDPKQVSLLKHHTYTSK